MISFTTVDRNLAVRGWQAPLLATWKISHLGDVAEKVMGNRKIWQISGANLRHCQLQM